jgi:hypothetical protein
MSSILKALKRLEHEKAARTPEAVRIDAEILRERTPVRRRPPYLVYFSLAGVLFFICGATLTYIYVKRDKAAAGAQPAVTSGSGAASTSQPMVQAKALPTATHKALKDRSYQPSAPRNAQQQAKHTPAAPLPVRPAAAQAAPPQATLPTPASGQMPTLRVDGIAYHMGSAESLAMVNGVAVYAGAVIEGAKVEEISRDRIRFSYNGEKFEVPLGKSNR